MATADKDFKVKNGLVVGAGGTFNGTVVVSTPTDDTHAATKAYVDANSGGASAINDLSDVTITSPSSGEVLKYNGSAWVNDTDATGSGGITTGKAIAMAMIFG